MLIALNSELAVIEVLMAKAEAILHDFQMSGVTASKLDEFRHVITPKEQQPSELYEADGL